MDSTDEQNLSDLVNARQAASTAAQHFRDQPNAGNPDASLVHASVARACAGPLAVVSRTPEPDSDAAYFLSLELGVVADCAAVVGEDEPCPHCGCATPMSDPTDDDLIF